MLGPQSVKWGPPNPHRGTNPSSMLTWGLQEALSLGTLKGRAVSPLLEAARGPALAQVRVYQLTGVTSNLLLCPREGILRDGAARARGLRHLMAEEGGCDGSLEGGSQGRELGEGRCIQASTSDPTSGPCAHHLMTADGVEPARDPALATRLGVLL